MSGLLETILKRTNYEYISDMNGKVRETSVKRALKEIDARAYSLEEWKEAISYLTSDVQEFLSLEEIENYIVDL